jgi:L-aspartate oxidase
MHKYDMLIIGSGLAGLSFALKAAESARVAVITKNELKETNTWYAQGGIAGVMDLNHDSFEKHIQDTLVAGAGLCDTNAVSKMVYKAPQLIQELVDYGVGFTRKGDELDLGKEGGHSENRIVHAADATGREVENVLAKRVKNHPNIDVYEYFFAMELLTEHHLGKKVKYLPEIHCFGVYALNCKEGIVETFLAKKTVLATGGIGEVYAHTTNPTIATGDGIAMAYRAKAHIQHMEFVQFHPTTLQIPEADSYLITEALRGFGAILRNSSGHTFMKDYDKRGELAPRDIVARAIDDQLKKRGDKAVFLDASSLESFVLLEHFPNIAKECAKYGLDITKDYIPVVPAAHYLCGGIRVDEFGQSSIKHLYAIGETACTGVHGANRLASNSLLEALHYADTAVNHALKQYDNIDFEAGIPDWNVEGTFNNKEWILVSHNREELQQVMWDYVGIVRSDMRLERALRRQTLLYNEVEEFYHRTSLTPELLELRNLISIAYLIIQAAMARKESCGLHYNVDYEIYGRPSLSDL